MISMELDDKICKLREFGISNDADSEAHYDADPARIMNLMKDLKMKIIKFDEEEIQLEFDIFGIGPPIVNAIRRILVAEIPTMAIDKVHVYNNTSIIPDEVLSHRLGLVPIKVDPRPFVCKDVDGEDTEEDTLKFDLKIKCSRRPGVSKDVPSSDDLSYINKKVFSEHLKFVPLRKQKDLYGDVRPVKEDILLAVLSPGHEIEIEAFCVKNIGRVHAKFSPVAVASYRLMPQITLLEEISGESAHRLAKIFPGAIKVSKKEGKARVVDPREVRCHRNIFFFEDLKDAVEVSRVKNHYIFTVESIGAIMPDVLVLEAIDVLQDKCMEFLNVLKSMRV